MASKGMISMRKNLKAAEREKNGDAARTAALKKAIQTEKKKITGYITHEKGPRDGGMPSYH